MSIHVRNALREAEGGVNFEDKIQEKNLSCYICWVEHTPG